MRSVEDLVGAVHAQVPGDRVDVTFVRAGNSQTLAVVLGGD